ncbi:hypothetical protein EJB05_32604 [Eragrostis curvula]|uniref:Glucan endo-1,3-beta-D-glucosidase n=1 Tax=Eragrostis curvula TaxID=38414 RepID=A0A5J9UGL5_9POAL|nr:hypothetical protein EJB05_32604 [Eragrostis curvula]
MARQQVASMLAVALIVGAIFGSVPTAVQSMGVCYGPLGSNLPSSSQVVELCKSVGIQGMRIYGPHKPTLDAMRNSGLGLLLDVGNDKVCELAASPCSAAAFVRDYVVPYYPAVDIRHIAVGNELNGCATDCIAPAMRNVHAALADAGLTGAIKVSTSVNYYTVVRDAFPPSSAAFARPYMADVARFLETTGAQLLANVFPYFAYAGNPGGAISLGFATFRPGAATVTDPGNGLTYRNLFDAMVDGVYAALDKAGAPNVSVVVSGSGWPSAGGFGASLENARDYNQRLINHTHGKDGPQGTPRRPGRMETYVFSMFNEDLKMGDPTARHFGLFYANEEPVYPINFRID